MLRVVEQPSRTTCYRLKVAISLCPSLTVQRTPIVDISDIHEPAAALRVRLALQPRDYRRVDQVPGRDVLFRAVRYAGRLAL